QGSKSELIVTFLVVLEMIRIGKVTIEQEENFADIIITNNDDNNERIDLAQIG
ncbi:MAG: segregation/condensation protein A, partial [Lachnospiraceae bacterium]|nr:segregation/condensation protein A [Lachnospiraceae bacterium]